MKNIYLLLIALTTPVFLYAQNRLPQLPTGSGFDKSIEQLQNDTKTDAGSTLNTLANWSAYPEINQKGVDYVFYYNDSQIGRIPVKVYIPSSYNSKQPNTCVMVLHGAVGISRFTDIDSLQDTDEDILVKPLKTQGYIIIQPIADEPKGLTWASKRQEYGKPNQWNHSYEILARMVTELKKVLNIDDNKVYAFGHSDGADGAIGLGIYKPDQFAGIVAYNAMFKNLFVHDYYICNIQNLPLYEAHSDGDKLRPIALNRQIIDSLKTFTSLLTYKEYAGYEHYDKHLSIDEPFADKFMKGTIRNLFKSNLYWESQQDSPYNTIDWLVIAQADTALSSATWHKPFDLTHKYFVKRANTWINYNYYEPFKSAAVKASFKNNVFELQTSGVKLIELRISPAMVNLDQPITVMANGLQVFKGKVVANKSYILKNFKQNVDRKTLWVNVIHVKID